MSNINTITLIIALPLYAIANVCTRLADFIHKPKPMWYVLKSGTHEMLDQDTDLVELHKRTNRTDVIFSRQLYLPNEFHI